MFLLFNQCDQIAKGPSLFKCGPDSRPRSGPDLPIGYGEIRGLVTSKRALHDSGISHCTLAAFMKSNSLEPLIV